MADLSQQLRLQQELNKVLSERQKILETNTQMFSKQAQMVKTLNDSMSGNQLDAMRQKIAGVKTGLDSASDSAKKMAGSTKDMGEAAKDAADDFDNFRRKAIAIGGAIGALKGFRVGIGLVRSALSGAVRLAGSFAKGVFNIGKAIVSIPFKMFSALLDMGGGGGSPVFLQALEKVRETFGDIATGSGLALKKSAFEIRKEFTKLTGTADIFRGPTFSRVFGRGREGLAKALEFNAEMATALGGSFASMRKGMEGNFASLAIYRKGLGLSAEAMANFMKFQDKAGEDYMKGFEEMSNIAIQVGEAFGFSAKEIGRTIGEMLEDVDNFSQFTATELGEMAVQTRRLGIEVKDLVGIRQGFDKFSDAVQRTSNMFRFFNMRLDPMDLFKEENPVKRIQMVQKAFKEAGGDVSKMNQRGIEQLAQQNNISVKTAKMLFSKKGLEMDYNAVKRQTEKAQKKQLTTAQVLSKLSRQIERVFGGGGGKYKGFFDAFAKGFGRGVRHTRAFRRMMININRSLRVTEMFGRRVGRSFVRNFPGVKQFLGAMADFFNPYKLIPALREISRAFDRFFRALRPGNEKKAFETFGSSVYETLDKYFGGKGEALELMRGAMTMIGEIILNLKLIAMEKTASIAAKGITEGTNILAAFLSDNADKSIGEIGQKYGGGIVDTIREKFGANAGKLADTIVNDLLPAIKKAAPVILEGFLFIFSKIGDFLEDNKDKIIPPMVEAVKRLMLLKFEVLRRVVMNSGMMGPVFAAMILGPTGVMALAGMAKTAAGIFLGKFAANAVARGARGSGILEAVFGKSAAFKRRSSEIAKEAAEATKKARDAASKAPLKGTRAFAELQYAKATGKAVGSETSKAAQKSLEKAVKPSGGLGRFFGKAGKLSKLIKIPGIGLAIDAAFAAYNMGETAKKAGTSKLQAFGAELASGLTFGLASVSDVYGFFGNDLAQANIVIAEQNERMTQIFEKTGQRLEPAVGKIQGLINQTTEKSVDMQKKAQEALEKSGNALTDEQKNVIQSFLDSQKAAQQEVVKINSELSKTKDKYLGLISVTENIKAEVANKGQWYKLGVDTDADVSLVDPTTGNNFTDQQKQALEDFLKNYAEQVGITEKNLITFNGQMATIHNDFYDDSAEEADKFTKALKEHFESQFKTNMDDLEKGAEEQRRVFDSITQAQSVYKAFQAAGDTSMMNTVRDQLFKDMVAKERESAQERAAQFLTDAGFYVPPQPTVFPGLMTAAKGKPTLEYLKEKNPAKHAELIASMNEAAQKATDDVLGGIGDTVAESTGETAKLDALEAAAVTLKRIEQLSDVPKRLKAAQKKLANVDADEVAARAGKVFTLAAKIGSAIDTELKKNPSLTTQNAQTVSSHFNDVMASAQRMASAVNSVLNASRKIPRERYLKPRLEKFKMATSEIVRTIKEMNLAVGEGAAVSPGVNDSIRSLQIITDGLIDSVPSELSRKAKASTTAIRAAATNIEEMKKLAGATDVKATVDLVKAITSGGRLEVVSKDDTKPMQVNIDLTVDSRRLGRAIVGVKDLKGKYAGKRIATTGD